MHRLNCDKCGKPLKYSTEMAGKAAKCARCGHSFVLPLVSNDEMSNRTVSEPSLMIETPIQPVPKQNANESSSDPQKTSHSIQLRLPNRCSRCCAPDPKETIAVQGSFSFQDGSNVTTITITTNVPACKKCHRRNSTYKEYVLYTSAIVIPIVLLFLWLTSRRVILPNDPWGQLYLVVVAGVMLIGISISIYTETWFCQMLDVSGRLKFSNKEFQNMYNELNAESKP